MFASASTMLLLAQTGDAAAAQAAAGLFGFFFVFFFCGFFLFFFAIKAFIIFLAYRLLHAVPAEYRRQEPKMVWLLLIPLFWLIWNFFVWPKISESYEAYFAAQHRADVGNANGSLALAFCICSVIPGVALAAVVILIVYLIKMFALKRQIGLAASIPLARV